MRPVNQKSIYSVLCKNIEEVDSCEAICLEDKIQKMEALVRASRMATDMTVVEQKRAKLEMEIQAFNKDGSPVHIREIETKGFDDTTH